MVLIFWILFAGLTAYIASQKGRNVILWGILGFAFSIFAVVAIICSKDLAKDSK